MSRPLVLILSAGLIVACKKPAAPAPDASASKPAAAAEPTVGWCAIDHSPEHWPGEGGIDALVAQLCPDGFMDVSPSVAAADNALVEGGKEHLFKVRAVAPGTVLWKGPNNGCKEFTFGIWNGAFVRQVAIQDPGGLPWEPAYDFTLEEAQAPHAFLRVACTGGAVKTDLVESKRIEAPPAVAAPQPEAPQSREACVALCEQPPDVEMDAWDDLPPKERAEAQRNWLEAEKEQLRKTPEYKACVERCGT